MRVRPRAAPVLLALAGLAYCGLFAANSLIRVRTFTADSMNYVDVARRVAGGDGLVQSTGGFNQPFYLSGDLDLPAAFTAQPPGYPLAIAFLSRLGLDAADAALVVSAVAYVAILALVYLLGKRIGGSAAGAIALGVALLYVPLTHLGRAALSECLAVAVVLLFFLLLDRYRAGLFRRATIAAFGLGLLAGAALSVRYALWPLPFVGVAALWLALRPKPRSGGTYDSAAFAAGALAPIAAILARNVVVEGGLLPAAMPAVRSLGENLSLGVTALLGGWRSTTVGNWPDAVLLVVALSVLVVLAARGRASSLPLRRLPLLIGVWAILCLAAVVWRGTHANFDPIGARLALPATVPLIPVFGALLAGALPRVRRFAWLPAAILVLCAGGAFVREVNLWSSGRDARAVEFRSERQQWLRDHTGAGDLVIGGGTMDVPFLVPGSSAISYAGLPYTEVLTYPTLERIADRHCPAFDSLLLVVRPNVQLGGTRSDEDPSNWLGPFIADIRAGHHEPYPLLEPLAALNEARIYNVSCS